MIQEIYKNLQKYIEDKLKIFKIIFMQLNNKKTKNYIEFMDNGSY